MFTFIYIKYIYKYKLLSCNDNKLSFYLFCKNLSYSYLSIIYLLNKSN